MEKFNFSDKKNWPVLALIAVSVISALFTYDAYQSYNDWQEITAQDIYDSYTEGGDYIDYVASDYEYLDELNNKVNTGGLVTVASAVAAVVVYKKRKAQV